MKIKLSLLVLLIPLFFLTACTSDKNNETSPISDSESSQRDFQENNSEINTSEENENVYEVNTEASVVKWNAQKVLVRTNDHFGTIDPSFGKIILDENGELVGGSIVMDMESIQVLDTDSTTLLNHIKSADFFEVENYPTAEFTLKRVEKLEDSEFDYLATGDMTIKGKTNEIEVMVKFEADGDLISAETKFEIDRTRWDIIYGSGNFFKELGDNVIDDMIGFDIRIVATK